MRRTKSHDFKYVEEVLRDLPEIIRDRDILMAAAVDNAAFPSGSDAGVVQSSVRLFQQERFLLDKNRDMAEKLDEVVVAIVDALGWCAAEDVEIVNEWLIRGKKKEDVAKMLYGDNLDSNLKKVYRAKEDVCRAIHNEVDEVKPIVNRWREWRGDCQDECMRRFGF